MIVGLPLAAGYLYRLRKGDRSVPGRDVDVLSATIFAVFVVATIKSVADVTQVAQLGRYYLPVYAVMIPTAVAGVIHWLEKLRIDRRAFGWMAASYVALVWADPTWAYDASWFVKPYQLHWPALREAGDWIKDASRPAFPPDARVMTWFPWEVRVASDRTTVLMPRNYSAARISEVDPPVQCDARPLGLVRAARARRPRDLGAVPGTDADRARPDPGSRTPSVAARADLSRPALPTSLGTPAMRWSVLVLVAILVFDVWYRAHTFAPTVVEATGLNLWPATVGPSEPLDCDEAIYAHMGRRLLAGDVLYRDLTENKPPLGYWLYATPIALFGYNELAIRLFPIPYVLGTIALVWWIGLKLSGPSAGCVAAALYAMLSTDPYLYGNGSNLEHQMNFFSVASLALILLGWTKDKLWPTVLAGVSLGAATLVKQVAVLPLLVYGACVAGRAVEESAEGDLRRCRSGFGLPLVLAAAVLLAQGAGVSAYDDIFRFGRAMATDTLPEPGAPSAWVRWLTGNADPTGQAPLAVRDHELPRLVGERKLAALAGGGALRGPSGVRPERLGRDASWSPPGRSRPASRWFCRVSTGPITTCCRRPGSPSPPRSRWPIASPRFASGSGSPTSRACSSWLAAILGTAFLQARDYLLCPPQELTIRYKGGGQWVFLRNAGA